MGLIGLLITLGIILLGSGYYFFGNQSTSFSLSNNSPEQLAQGIDTYTELKDKASDIKDTAEEKAKEAMQVLDDTLPQKTEEKTVPQQPISVPSSEKETNAPTITNRLMSSGFSVPAKPRKIDTIVLHSSYNPNGGDPYSVSAIVKIYEGYGVSAHYLIDREGKIYRLVEDKNIAYHAGVSKMPDGRTDVNNFSLGIELINKEDTEYTEKQYKAVNDLVSYLKKKYPIKSVVGHDDIAPDRKTDPWNFDWKRLK